MTDDHPLANEESFRSLIGGREVSLLTLRSGDLKAQVTNYGGRLVSLACPDRTGRVDNVTLGLDSPDAYVRAKERYYGATIGRFANRIGGGRFDLDGRTFRLPCNDGTHHLHGGAAGFHDVVWEISACDSRSVTLTHTSPDGEGGYPGTLSCRVVYRLTDEWLEIAYEASTDSATIVNLTNHAYWNLEGAGAGSIVHHLFEIDADGFTPIDESLIPTGEIAAVEGTPFDLREAASIVDRLEADSNQIRYGRGFDHNFVISTGRPVGGLRRAARVEAPVSGRILEVLTTEPGIQFYSGNFFDGSDIGASGMPHRYRESFALETQHFPDSPNKSGFPSVVLEPGEQYSSTTRYKFSTR